MERTLSIRDVCVSYSGVQVLDGVSVDVRAGKIVCLVGESGSGKSTLLHAVMGTLPASASVESGTAMLGDVDLIGTPESELCAIRGARIAMVFQNPDMVLCPVIKVRKHFKDMLVAHGAYDAATFEQTVVEVLEKLDLHDGKHILDSYPFELSGGMSQRVGIALACVLHPEFLLADEPTSALDVTTQLQVIDEMLRLRDDFGLGVLLVTHNMGIVSMMADEVGVCYAGQLVEYGSVADVLDSPSHPYTQALLAATPQIGGGMPVSLDGRPPEFAAMPGGCRFAPRCAHVCTGCEELAHGQAFGTADHWCLCPRGGQPC